MATIEELEKEIGQLLNQLTHADDRIDQLKSALVIEEEKTERLHNVIDDIGGMCREALR